MLRRSAGNITGITSQHDEVPGNSIGILLEVNPGAPASATVESESELFDRRRSQYDPGPSVDLAQSRHSPVQRRTHDAVIQRRRST